MKLTKRERERERKKERKKQRMEKERKNLRCKENMVELKEE